MNPSKAYLLREIQRYLAAVPDATERELVDLNAWVQQGNSPFSNPSHIADELGREMPFIQALRAERELAEDYDASISPKAASTK